MEKSQLIKKFYKYTDLLNVLLVNGKNYTQREVKKLIKNYLEGSV